MLKRSVGVSGALLLTVSAITPASSVFVILPGALRIAGTGTLLAMLAALAVGVCLALVYAELASAFPRTGGEYVFVAHTLGPSFGFMFLGLTVVGAVMSPAVLALGVGSYISNAFPAAGSPALLAAATIAIATALGILNIRSNAALTGALLGVELAALVLLSYFGFSGVSRPLSTLLIQPVALVDGVLAPAQVSAIGLAASLAIFAYNGYGGAVYFGEEMHDAPKRVARTILWALGIGVATQIVPVTAVLLGANDLKALFSSDVPFNEFIQSHSVPWVDTMVSVGVGIALFNAVIVVMLSNARLLFSTGRDGAWAGPLNRWLVTVHPRFHSPWVATILAGFVSIVPCFIELQTLLIFTGSSLIAIYAGLCVAVILGRHRGGTAHGSYRMPWFPFAPALGLVILTYLAFTTWSDTDVGRPSFVINGVVVLISLAYYWLVLRRRGLWRLIGPADEQPAG